MENAAEALKMAAAILIFIIAIGSAFSLFGIAKQTADSIITMRDKQAYLEAAELDNGILYTSSSAIAGNDLNADITTEYISGVTSKGDRVVNIDDVISTIYRYSIEKYGVTIVESNGDVIARFDSNTETIMAQYSNIDSSKFSDYKNELERNTATIYTIPKFDDLEDLYKIGNSNIGYGAPWYGNSYEIQKRINADLSGKTYTNEHTGQTYKGKGLLSFLESSISHGKKIIEVTNEIDKSKYLEDSGSSTNLLQQYEMPTVEIIYIIY